MACHGDRSPSLARRTPRRLAFILALGAIAGAVCAAPARAQSAPMKPPAAASSTPITVRAEGGVVFCCADTGFIAGANIGAAPQALEGVEVSGDAAVGRFGGFSLLYFSGDAVYARRVGPVTPYGGGGIGIARTGGGPTNTGFQIVGGVQLPTEGRHRIRVEARFLFLPVVTTFVMASVSF